MTTIDRTLVLWDVDHTLIENSGVSKATYARAFEMLTGIPTGVNPDTDGRTDFEILQILFGVNGITTPKEYREIFERALSDAMAENRASLRERGHALPGAKEVLAVLAGEKNIIQSALTGNIANNAREKLAAFKLDKYLDLEVGGYGSDHIVRAELVRAARGKVFEKYGVEFDRDSTIMIGDTVRDVQAALEGDAIIIGVATGKNYSHQLLNAGAHAVMENLVDTEEVVRVIQGVRARNS
ncbi:MAG: HAD family hydrolase [Pseudonocardiales bacterium]